MELSCGTVQDGFGRNPTLNPMGSDTDDVNALAVLYPDPRPPSAPSWPLSSHPLADPRPK
jgi:hypothetical protein